ncbi:MAG: LPS export ABC transporter permease LptG [Oleiphilaceae bacterium]|nr:LPS export ABC transporter permease LptG [Oleiphilaceae bacterium]
MRRLDRYIVATVSASMLLVLAVVLSLDFLFALIAEMEELKNDYQVFEALKFVVTTLPRRIYDYLPLAAFMGCLIGLGGLAKSSELVVIRAAGVSSARIVWSAMKPAIALVLMGVLLGEYVAPYAEKVAQSQRAVAQGAQSFAVAQRGVWHREGDVFMHFNAVEPNGVLHGVSLYTFDNTGSLEVTRFSRRAIYQRGEWVMSDVLQSRFTEGGVKSHNEPFYVWRTDLTPEVLSVLIVKPENLSVTGLLSYASYLKEQGLSAAEYMLAFWKKTLQPVATMALVLVAISFVFGPLRSVTMGFRIFCGVVVGLLFKYVQDLLGPSSIVFGFDPVLASLLPILACLLLGAMLLRRAG